MLIGIAASGSSVNLAVNPPTASIPLGSTQQLTVTANSAPYSNVAWYVVPGSHTAFTQFGPFAWGPPGGSPNVGTVSPTGVFTAPTTTPFGIVSVLAYDNVTCSVSNPTLVAFH
jgi:hypothetical protein